MKYGLIVFKETKNIGDDIQSYAAKRFLPKIDYYIDREKLNEFLPKTEEIVSVILNGWFLHNVFSVPPSPYINPLFISVHFTDHLKNQNPEYLNGYFIDYLKKYSPIGLRDNLVQKYLTDKGVDNYLSLCLTLTIEPFENVKNSNYVCAVDLKSGVLDVLKNNKTLNIKCFSHTLDAEENSSLSYGKRFENVETLLKEYQASKFVVTSRLHCALPCVAMGVPVIFIYDDNDLDVRNRISIFSDILYFVSEDEFLNNKIEQLYETALSYKGKHLCYKSFLEQKVKEFIQASNDIKPKNLISIADYKKYSIEQKNYLLKIKDDVYESKIKELKDLNNIIIDDYKKKINWLEITKNSFMFEHAYMLDNIKRLQLDSDYLNACQGKIALANKVESTFIYKILRKIKQFIKGGK